MVESTKWQLGMQSKMITLHKNQMQDLALSVSKIRKNYLVNDSTG